MKLTDHELTRIRDIRIHRLLNIPDRGYGRVSLPCPIHIGKNDNFNVYSDNSFHCFKCGANGSGAIDFVMKLGFTFVQALEELVRYI